MATPTHFWMWEGNSDPHFNGQTKYSVPRITWTMRLFWRNSPICLRRFTICIFLPLSSALMLWNPVDPFLLESVLPFGGQKVMRSLFLLSQGLHSSSKVLPINEIQWCRKDISVSLAWPWCFGKQKLKISFHSWMGCSKGLAETLMK